MDFSLDLKKWRKKRGISQQELAESLGLAQSNISEFENGSRVPSLERAVEIANTLGITLDELVQYEKAHSAYSSKLAEKFYKK